MSKFQNLVHNYLDHGGSPLIHKGFTSPFCFFCDPTGSVDWIYTCLLRSSAPWLIDDLSPFQICLVGALAQVDFKFCKRLKSKLATYISPFVHNRDVLCQNVFESSFGFLTIKSLFKKLSEWDQRSFLALLCRTGTTSLVKTFLDLGVDVNCKSTFILNLLANAAVVNNMEVVRLLIDADADGALAIPCFLGLNSTSLSDEQFKRNLGLLVENVKPSSIIAEEYFLDPLLSTMTSERACAVCPEASWRLLHKILFNKRYLGTTGDVWYSHSYMYRALLLNDAELVSGLLKRGEDANAPVCQSFYCLQELRSLTWLTLAIACGNYFCVDVLIQEGADITALDGNGRSAIHMATSNVAHPHPRFFRTWDRSNCKNVDYKIRDILITAEEDAEILAIVEHAFNAKFKGTKLLQDYVDICPELDHQISKQQEEPTSLLQYARDKTLEVFFSPHQIVSLKDHLRILYYHCEHFWSLPFSEALFIRTFYVLSWALLFVRETIALVQGQKRIPVPFRVSLSGLAVLALAIIWSSPYMDLVNRSIWGTETSE